METKVHIVHLFKCIDIHTEISKMSLIWYLNLVAIPVGQYIGVNFLDFLPASFAVRDRALFCLRSFISRPALLALHCFGRSEVCSIFGGQLAAPLPSPQTRIKWSVLKAEYFCAPILSCVGDIFACHRKMEELSPQLKNIDLWILPPNLLLFSCCPVMPSVSVIIGHWLY